MVAVPDSSVDNDASFTVFGTNADDQPLRDWQTGELGLSLPCVAGSYGFDPRNVPAIKTIDRIVKDPTVGGVSLYASDGTHGTQLISYYWPEDTEPYFRRIRLGTSQAAVRIMFRKRWLKITSLLDPIPLRSRMAIISAAQGVVWSRRRLSPGRVPDQLQPERGCSDPDQSPRLRRQFSVGDVTHETPRPECSSSE
jgi:hypothetical protein